MTLVLMEPAGPRRCYPPHSLLLLLCSLVQLSAQFTVVGPSDPILVLVGENITLCCHLFPEKNAQDMEVRWFRSQFSPAVLVYKGRQERNEEQMTVYRGRTTFVSEDIQRGRVALVIHNVTAHENGIYRCYFQEGRSYDEAVMRVMVAGLGSPPLIEMKVLEDGGIWLECTSGGWYPEPRAVWRDPYGEVVQALEEAYAVDTDGLFTVTLAVIIRDCTVRNMSCAVNNTLLGQEEESVIFIPGGLQCFCFSLSWASILPPTWTISVRQTRGFPGSPSRACGSQHLLLDARPAGHPTGSAAAQRRQHLPHQETPQGQRARGKRGGK